MPLTHQLRTIKNVLRNVFARERLEEAPERSDPPPGTPDSLAAPPSFAAMLFAREPLAMDPEPRADARRLGWAGPFAREPLAEDPEPPASAARAGILRALLAPEPLPEHPPTPPRREETAWLRWLFRPEPLDPP